MPPDVLRLIPTATQLLVQSLHIDLRVFSEPVDASVSGVRVTSAEMTPRNLSVVADPHDVSVLVANTDSLAPGEYRVSWRTVSVDGHKVSGTFEFTVRGDTTKHSPVKLQETGCRWGKPFSLMTSRMKS